MLVRIRAPNGNHRFTLEPSDDISVLVQKILETSNEIDPDTLALSNQPRGGENPVSGITGDLASLGISHGDLLFASYKTRTAPSALSSHPASGTATPTTSSSSHAATLAGKPVPLDSLPIASTSSSTSTSLANGSNDKQTAVRRPWEEAKEDEVDRYWEQKDGKIARPKGQHGCRCGPKSMCDHCMPLEPFDAEYHASHNIKHLSYHAYLKKLHASIPSSAQSSTYIPPLSEESYRVAVPCSSGSHPPWPAGICTKCQPSAITLTRQQYRMVDHVEFANPALIDGLLGFWRQTGTQRFGYLLGTYAPYEEVPMGVKAVVEAIHEPPQEPHADGITVGFPWEEEAKVQALADACGLQIVGVIFTDLTPDTSSDDAKKAGKVVAKRHANSFFLSSLEVLFSASLQRKHPTASRFSMTGRFSSRFVTCVLSGDIEGQIAVEAYQVSDQAMAMVDADMVEASVDPGIVRVKEEGPTRYIPDVFYRYKNKYGLEVKESAKPCFPVEYLLVNVTHGFPVSPNPLFTSPTPFTHENRAGLQDQTLSSVASSLVALAKDIPAELLSGTVGTNADPGEREKELEVLSADEGVGKVARWLSDWHLLRFLTDCGMFEDNDLRLMCRIATIRPTDRSIASQRERATVLAQLFASPGWQTFMVVAQEQAPAPPPRTYPGGSDSSAQQHPTQTLDGFDIPPDIDMPPEASGSGSGAAADLGAAAGAGAGVGGAKVCPHCTFENPPDAGADCEVCGLPLSG
ncbi:Nuclear protein localization protein 4 [Rhodotorula toruloides]|uniref:Nuclear protein localization protein 4 n=1 Tax=Rhodotorula toruloides TaxID=5286 RepID=A0A0K3CED4_RHOTO|nr:Nuclear protein localization protein 4 [Rhodotorula toruloides]PRQ75106.1 NPL4 family-domain containing protein [Rhodotorula toruloides]